MASTGTVPQPAASGSGGSSSSTETCLSPRTMTTTILASPTSDPKSPRSYLPWASSAKGPLNAHPPSIYRPNSQPPPAHPGPRRSYLSATKEKYTQSKPGRKKLLLLLSGSLLAICLVALIVGLAAGLTLRKKQDLALPSAHGGPYRGELTYYAPGVGACGSESRDGDRVVALSMLLFDEVGNSANPNLNPLCGKKVRARREGRSVDLVVVDRCVACRRWDLDVTEKVFAGLGEVEEGRIDVEWSWLEDVPGVED
jgi:hypothetical protein